MRIVLSDKVRPKLSLGLAACGVVWAAAGLVAWIVAAGGISNPQSSSGIALWSLVCAGISAAVRLDRLVSSPAILRMLEWRRSRWFVAWLGNTNWLGYMVLCSSDVVGALPACFLIALVEVCLIPRCREDFAEDPSNSSEALKHQATSDFSVASASPSKGLAEQHSRSVLLESAESIQADALEQNVASDLGPDEQLQTIRRQTDSIDPEGRRVVAGELLISLAAGQKQESIVIAFQAPFQFIPKVELECESDDATAQIVNCTQRGMRLSIKRQGRDVDEIVLAWFASEPTVENPSSVSQNTPLAASRLP